VASVKPSGQMLGKDRTPSKLFVQPDVIRGRNVTLKSLILEAYDLRPHQVTGGPEWLDEQEYDIEARWDGPATRAEIRRMLQALITERFRFLFHRQMTQMSVYGLVVDKDGPKINPLPDSTENRAVIFPSFHGSLQDLADLIGFNFPYRRRLPQSIPPSPTSLLDHQHQSSISRDYLECMNSQWT
jgi:uncharacterized protein (TIGR03435 family)